MDWAERLEQASRERVAPDMPLMGILEIINGFAWIPILLVEGNVKTLQAVNEGKTHSFLSQVQGKLELYPLDILLSNRLSNAIMEWDDIFQKAFDKHISEREDLAKFMDIQAFNIQGHKLFERICQELPHFQIIYRPLELGGYTKF